MALLVVGGRRELRDAHVAQVERRHQALDRAALARGVPALEDAAHGRPQLAVAELAAEREAQRREALVTGLEALRLLRLLRA